MEAKEPKPNVVEPLKGPALDIALKDVRNNNGLFPTTVNRLLTIETAQSPHLSIPDKIVPGALMAGYVATYAASRLAGGDFPSVDIPPVLHELLQAVHNLSQNSAKNPTLREHLPYILLEGAAIWAAAKTLPDWIRTRGKRQQVREAQQVVQGQVSGGEFKYAMAQGHTAAFIGLGDPLAESLQQANDPDQVMLYSHARIDNQVWQLISKNGQQEEIFQVLDRGNFQNAGEVLLLPVKYEDMFLPDKTGNDMTIDEIAAVVHVIDDYAKSRGIPTKNVVIVGSKDMQETYISRADTEQAEKSQKTLAELVDELNQQRTGAKVEIIDPTEIVMEKIDELARGRYIEFVSTEESDQRYGQRFYEQLKRRNYQPTTSESVKVLYNITDVPTEVGAGKDDIAVIFDPPKKQGLLAKGLPEENIVVVPDITLQALSSAVT